jgi:glycosyltransferase involved in cell wall biosynthesis
VTVTSGLNGLSVLVTCYNKIEFVEKCFLALVEMENLGASVIIIDDGSTDGSSELLVKLKKDLLSNIQIIRTANQGAGPARLLSIEKSETDFVFFLDIDDLPIVPGIQKLFCEFRTSNADLAIGNYKLIQNNDLGIMPLAVGEFKIVTIYDYRQEFKDAMGWWRYIYRRNFLIQQHNIVGKAFEELGDKKFVLDDLFWMSHLCAQDLEVLVSPSYLSVYEYNLPEDNTDTRWKAYLKQVSYLPEAAEKFLNFIEKNGCSHNEDWLKENTLNDIWNHMPLIPIKSYHKSYLACLKLTVDFQGKNPTAYLKGALYLVISILKRVTRVIRELQSH